MPEPITKYTRIIVRIMDPDGDEITSSHADLSGDDIILIVCDKYTIQEMSLIKNIQSEE
jgi:hypothetical protein